MRDFDVVLLEDETGGYVAIVPALPGCHTQGDTLSEVMENIKEAITAWLWAEDQKALIAIPPKPGRCPIVVSV